MLPSDEIVYFIAKIVIVYNLTSQKQRFYTEHTEELRSIAQHPNLWIVATGQSSGTLQEETGHIRIWDSKSMITLNVLSLNDIDLSVECLAFSQVRILLAACFFVSFFHSLAAILILTNLDTCFLVFESDVVCLNQ